MSLARGTTLGPYEVTALIGAGGMGEVYAARDGRLDRDVAIKVLPPEFAEDPTRRERFEREAKAVAALSHPNIVSLFDSGVHDGRAFVVMELLSGQTLRAMLDAGPPPVRKALEIAAQVARGLAAAHDRHLVHRDLKPENVFVLPDGRVKILDFGLARRVDTRTGATETRAAVTDPGSVMGTVGYMAPEQVRGQDVDARTDIFAFGAVLYEILSGRRAFHGDTAADTMFAIVKEDPPDLLSVRGSLPAALDRIVRHCLEKNPAERFQSARDVAFAIEALSGSGSSASGPRAVPAIDEAPRRRGMNALVALILGAVLASATFGAWSWWAAPRRHWPAEWIAEDLGGPVFAAQPRVSPDGQYVAFQAMVDDQTQVGLLRTGSGTWQIVTSDRTKGGVISQSWSRDGTRILFDRIQELPRGAFSVPVPTGTESPIVRDASNPHELPNRDVLLTQINQARQPQLYLMRRGGRVAEPLPAILASTWNGFRVFRDGREAVYFGRPVDDPTVTRDELRVIDLQTGRSRRLAPHLDVPWGPTSGFPVAAVDDWVVIAVPAGDLMRVVAVPRDGAAAAETLFTTTTPILNLDVGVDGAIYLDQFVAGERVVWIRPGSNEVQVVELPNTGNSPPVALPKGEALGSIRSAGRVSLAVLAPGKLPRPFAPTLRDEETRGPAARLGRDRVAFLVGPLGKLQIAIATVDDGLVTRRLSRASANGITALAGSPDGRMLYYVSAQQVWVVPSDDSGDPQKIRQGDGVAVDPDGRYLVVQVNDKDQVRLFKVPVTGGEGTPIPIDPAARITSLPISANAVGPDGRIAIRVAPADSWYWPTALLDPLTGRVDVLEPKRGYDVWGASWTDDGRIVMTQSSARSRMWRFRPAR